ncbi:unnamed protein product [Chrysoparadoxa australica]
MTIRIDDSTRRQLLTDALQYHNAERPPDFVIGSPRDPYLQRWFVVRKGLAWLSLLPEERRRILAEEDPRDDSAGGGNLFVHEFLRSDDDRALHDHPWPWTTIILAGHYIEHVPADPDDPAGPTRQILRREGDVVQRAAHDPHRVELIDQRGVITLFHTSAKVRDWGFWCHWGWRPWWEFVAPDDSGRIGRGCE